jgi:hypothetical protein
MESPKTIFLGHLAPKLELWILGSFYLITL